MSSMQRVDMGWLLDHQVLYRIVFLGITHTVFFGHKHKNSQIILVVVGPISPWNVDNSQCPNISQWSRQMESSNLAKKYEQNTYIIQLGSEYHDILIKGYASSSFFSYYLRIPNKRHPQSQPAQPLALVFWQSLAKLQKRLTHGGEDIHHWHDHMLSRPARWNHMGGDSHARNLCWCYGW